MQSLHLAPKTTSGSVLILRAVRLRSCRQIGRADCSLLTHCATECSKSWRTMVAVAWRVSAYSIVWMTCVAPVLFATQPRLWPSRKAACALLYEMTSEPFCECPRWHPLPVRACFESTFGTSRGFASFLNPPSNVLTFYEPQRSWTFNISERESDSAAPAWHSRIRTAENDFVSGQMFDIELKVCHLHDVLCAEVFEALVAASNDETLFLYQNVVVRGLVDHAWWNGACRITELQGFLRTWELGLMLYGSWLASQVGFCYEDAVVELIHNFVGYRGIVDILHELALIVGCLKIGGGTRYMWKNSVLNLLLCGVSCLLLVNTSDARVLMCAILSRWCLLGEVFLCAEKLSIVVVPIHRLLKSVVPAMLITLTAFVAIMQAMYCLRDEAHSRDSALPLRTYTYEIFCMLFTTELSDEPDHNVLALWLTEVSTFMFSIFYLNIFIAILSDNYSKECESIPLVIQQRRAECCFAHLIRSRILPCRLLTKEAAFVTGVVAAATALVFQVHSIRGVHEEAWVPCGAFVCQVMMYLSAYQNKTAPWVTDNDEGNQHFLWLVLPREVEAKQGRQALLKRLQQWGLVSTPTLSESLGNQKDFFASTSTKEFLTRI
eukprot:TRINITY_DN47336_c0_g1_i4.p1 TRINITY_DN47336_c0_g1~~TRINITY_DN47336_c0_g1_i4.p1  ORF type:complete len:606 (+),score=70.23 TRINITY_DN47336_c0_g1_i4:538-2355(+)